MCSIVNYLNAILPSNMELELSNVAYDQVMVWRSNNDLSFIRNGDDCTIVYNKRLVNFLESYIMKLESDDRKNALISILNEIGIDASKFESVTVMSHNDATIYVVGERDSYGDLKAYHYTHNKNHIYNESWYTKYGYGMVLSNQVVDLWTKV